MAAAPLRHEVFYPESDGQPMAETGLHVHELFKLYGLLKEHFKPRADVYLTANMFLYYVEGDPRSVVAPDLFVARGVAGNHERRTWQVWREGVPPCFVLARSPRTRRSPPAARSKSGWPGSRARTPRPPRAPGRAGAALSKPRSR